MKKPNILLIAILSVFLISCEKDVDTGISLKIKASTDMVVAKSSGGTIEFTEATVGIDEIEIKSEEEEFENDSIETENEYEFEGPFVVDLLAGTSNPDLGAIEFEPGVYDKLEAEISNLLDGNYSVVIKGNYTALDGNVYPFVFSLKNSFDLKIEDEVGITVNEGDISTLLVDINLALLFSGIDLEKAEISADNTILIDKDNNRDMADVLEEFLEEATEMDDDDGDDD